MYMRFKDTQREAGKVQERPHKSRLERFVAILKDNQKSILAAIIVILLMVVGNFPYLYITGDALLNHDPLLQTYVGGIRQEEKNRTDFSGFSPHSYYPKQYPDVLKESWSNRTSVNITEVVLTDPHNSSYINDSYTIRRFETVDKATKYFQENTGGCKNNTNMSGPGRYSLLLNNKRISVFSDFYKVNNSTMTRITQFDDVVQVENESRIDPPRYLSLDFSDTVIDSTLNYNNTSRGWVVVTNVSMSDSERGNPLATRVIKHESSYNKYMVTAIREHMKSHSEAELLYSQEVVKKSSEGYNPTDKPLPCIVTNSIEAWLGENPNGDFFYVAYYYDFTAVSWIVETQAG